jgi:predicted DNA-binding WGR domain protein
MAPTTMTPVRRSARVAASRAAAATATAVAASSTATATTAKKKNTTAGAKKKTSHHKTKTHGHVKSSPPAKKKQKHTGLQATVDSSAPLGVIDPASNITDGSIMTLPPPGDEQQEDNGAPADAMLVLVDPAKNHDKFFVLQCIERTGGNNNNYCVYSRWGRTGTAGQALQQDFDDAGAAQQVFEAKFRQKTGLTWSERHQPYQGGMYRFIVQDFIQKQDGYANGQWQYYVDDGVDGKVDGWYDYDANGSVQVEILYHQHAQNPQLSQRQVASGYFTYHVDLDHMTQTNTSHPGRKSRRIRRVVVEANDEEEEDEEEEEGKEEETEEAATIAVSPPMATLEPPVTTDAAATSAVTVTPPRPRRRGQAATVPTPMVSPSPARSSSSSSAAGASASS